MAENKGLSNAQKSREELRKRHQKEDKRQKNIKRVVIASITIAVIVLVGVIGWSLKSGLDNAKQNSVTKGEQLTPNMITEQGSFHIVNGVVVKDSTPTGATRVDNFYDPMCPGCGLVDRAIGEDIKNLSTNGDIDLYMTPVAFLDSMSTDKYSTRAINAMVTVAENDPEHFLDFVNALYKEDNQPQESASYISVSDEKLAKTAKSVGVSADAASKIKERHYIDWIDKNSKTQMNNKTLFADGFSTPSIFLNITYTKGNDAADGYTKVAFDNNDIKGTFEKALASAK